MPTRRIRYFHDGHGTFASSRRSKPRELECCEALDLIDALRSPTDRDAEALNAHVKSCSTCCSAYRIEGSIRQVIAPIEMSTPSLRFEEALMRQIGLGAEELPAIDPLSKWGWLVGVIALCGLLATKATDLFLAVRWVRGVALTLYAWAVSYLRGNTAVVMGKFAPGYFQLNTMLGMLLLATLIVAAGVLAVRSVGRR